MRHYGLIGRKLGHSFSAKFFTAKFQSEGVDADYQLYELESIGLLPKLMADYRLDGFNVTIPYKESIMPYLDELTTEAREVGAVNCVAYRGIVALVRFKRAMQGSRSRLGRSLESCAVCPT